MKETARVPPLLDSPQSAAPETFLSRDAVSAFPLLFGPLPQPLPGARCPEWDALLRWPWRFCVNSSPPPAGRGGRPVLSPASGSQSLPQSAANPDSCAYREAPASETKSRASGSSNSSVEIPRSASTPSTGGNPKFAATSPILENSACTNTTLSENSFNLSRAISSARGSRSIATNRPVARRRAISIAWPPVPAVASTYVPSGRMRSHSKTASSKTGVCKTLKI